MSIFIKELSKNLSRFAESMLKEGDDILIEEIIEYIADHSEIPSYIRRLNAREQKTSKSDEKSEEKSEEWAKH